MPSGHRLDAVRHQPYTRRTVYGRKRHDNESVAATDESLRRICSQWDAQVDVKQRVADVLDIDALQLRSDLRWYALSCHFDFVVWRRNEPQFAVEFDERHHFTDPAQLVRDEKKNAICEAAYFPLLRIEEASLKRIGGAPLVEWLADLYFVYHDLWLPARAGWDEGEGFNADDWDDDLYVEVKRHDEFTYTDFMTGRPSSGVPEHSRPGPLDPFHEARRALTLRDAQTFGATVPSWFNGALGINSFTETDPQGRAVGHVAVPVDGGVVIGTGRCWNPGSMFCGDPNLGSWIAVDLAGQQAADFLDLYDRGRLVPIAWEQAERRLRGLDDGLFMTALLDQHDHRQISYRHLRKFGMDHHAALMAAYSLRWDAEGRLADDPFDDS
jgi:hypothetical protein